MNSPGLSGAPVFSGVAEHIRAGNHALLELFGERGPRTLARAGRSR
jgi:hypothetical protein